MGKCCGGLQHVRNGLPELSICIAITDPSHYEASKREPETFERSVARKQAAKHNVSSTSDAVVVDQAVQFVKHRLKHARVNRSGEGKISPLASPAEKEDHDVAA